MPEAGVVATFREPGAAAVAIRALRARGFAVRAAMPAPFPEVVEAIGRPRSGLDRAAILGALAGVAVGAAIASATSLAWPLRTGGMPFVSSEVVGGFALVPLETRRRPWHFTVYT